VDLVSVASVVAPPLLILLALGLGIGADRARVGARQSGLQSLRIGTVALMSTGLLTGVLALLLAVIVIGEAVGVSPFPFLPPLPVVMNLLGAGLALSLLLDGAVLATGLYWEYGRAVAWWRGRGRLLRWLVHGPLCCAGDPQPPASQRAVSRARGIAVALPLLAFPLAISLADERLRLGLLGGDPLIWGTFGVLVVQGGILLILALVRGDRSAPGTPPPNPSPPEQATEAGGPWPEPRCGHTRQRR
jgi:hypothetical protein